MNGELGKEIFFASRRGTFYGWVMWHLLVANLPTYFCPFMHFLRVVSFTLKCLAMDFMLLVPVMAHCKKYERVADKYSVADSLPQCASPSRSGEIFCMILSFLVFMGGTSVGWNLAIRSSGSITWCSGFTLALRTVINETGLRDFANFASNMDMWPWYSSMHVWL